jgi:hypothetical protein
VSGHGWAAIEDNTSAAHMHVVPVNDLREHAVSQSCWCRPTPDDGVIVHHSMDLREEFEEGRKAS